MVLVSLSFIIETTVNEGVAHKDILQVCLWFGFFFFCLFL